MKLIKINQNLYINPERVDKVVTTSGDYEVARTKVHISQGGVSYFVEQCESEKAAQRKAASLVKLINAANEVNEQSK